METTEENTNERMDTTSFVDSLSFLTENSSALGIRLLAMEEYFNYAQNDIKILKTKINLLSEANDNTMKNRDELLSRNRTNIISLEGLFNVQSEFYNYKCDVKDDYIRTEEALKIKRNQYDKIINYYKMKWDAVELEYEKLPMASELSALEKENISWDAEAKRLEKLVMKTKADYFDKYNEGWYNLIAKILDFAAEYRIHAKFVTVTNEIGQKNVRLQELLQKLQSCEEPQVIRQYTDYFKPIPLIASIPPNGKGRDNSKFKIDLTLFDEISIPQDNLEMETEDESLFNLYENGRNFEMTHNPMSVLSCENNDLKKPTDENMDPVAVGDEYYIENHGDNEVTGHNIRANKNETEVFDDDMAHAGLNPYPTNVNDKRLQLSNQHLTSDVDAAQTYSKSSKNESGAKSVNTVALKKETKSFKLKERMKETRTHAEGEDKENCRSAPKKGKYSSETKNTHDSPKTGNADRVLSDNHITFDFGFKENFTQEEDQENEKSKFSFFLNSESSLSEGTSIFKLF